MNGRIRRHPLTSPIPSRIPYTKSANAPCILRKQLVELGLKSLLGWIFNKRKRERESIFLGRPNACLR